MKLGADPVSGQSNVASINNEFNFVGSCHEPMLKYFPVQQSGCSACGQIGISPASRPVYILPMRYQPQSAKREIHQQSRSRYAHMKYDRNISGRFPP